MPNGTISWSLDSSMGTNRSSTDSTIFPFMVALAAYQSEYWRNREKLRFVIDGQPEKRLSLCPCLGDCPEQGLSESEWPDCDPIDVERTRNGCPGNGPKTGAYYNSCISLVGTYGQGRGLRCTTRHSLCPTRLRKNTQKLSVLPTPGTTFQE